MTDPHAIGMFAFSHPNYHECFRFNPKGIAVLTILLVVIDNINDGSILFREGGSHIVFRNQRQKPPQETVNQRVACH